MSKLVNVPIDNVPIVVRLYVKAWRHSLRSFVEAEFLIVLTNERSE